MENQIAQLQLRAPQKTLSKLSFSATDNQAVTAWLNNLPKANIGEISRHLYGALGEINKLITTPLQRFQLLESLRPTVYYTLEALSKHYLGQTVVLNEQQKKVANLAQALQIYLATGYKQVILDNTAKDADKQLTGNAIHRAMSEMSRSLLRTYQLYCPPPRFLWLEIGQLYQFAEQLQLLDYSCKDAQNSFISSPSVLLVYTRAVLLGCSRANQLRQADLQQVFNALELWAPLSKIQLIAKNDPLFFINFESDHPPCYFSLSREPVTLACRGLNSLPLIHALKDSLKTPITLNEKPSITVPKSMSMELIKHLIEAWGPLKERSFKRMATQGELHITIGFSATHYFLSGEKDFARQLLSVKTSQRAAHFTTEEANTDAWCNAFDADTSDRKVHAALRDNESIKFSDHTETKKPEYRNHLTQISDTSPGGYCVTWPGNLPPQTQSGELLGVRESDSEPWCLAVIRWIKVESPERSLMGIELLTPNASPCALSMLRKTRDGSQAMRAFLLPEINAIAQPATLITPSRPFEEGGKVLLNQNGVEQKGQLTHKVMATRSFSQFEFKRLQQILQPALAKTNTTSDGEEDFTSVWKLL